MEFGPRAFGPLARFSDDAVSENAIGAESQGEVQGIFSSLRASVLREHVADWFEFDADSPYMLLGVRLWSGAGEPCPSKSRTVRHRRKLSVPHRHPRSDTVDYSRESRRRIVRRNPLITS